jgi:FkbM family methyltransferase
MSLLQTLRYIWDHPLASRERRVAISRYVRWQLGSRLSPGAVAVDFVNDARLLVRPGMTGATGNVYVGMHEFEDMAFVLHVLRADDLFVDVGANVGSYTVLAAKVAGARCVTFEPIAAAWTALCDNLQLNGITDRVELHRAAVGSAPGVARMTTGFDTGNRMAVDGQEPNTIEVPVLTLDEVLGARAPSVIKVDVEGFEPAVLEGAARTLAQPSLIGVVMETNRCASVLGAREAQAHEMMLAAGFTPCTYAPFERRLIDLHGAFKPDANTLYVRDVARASERLRAAPRFSVLGQTL